MYNMYIDKYSYCVILVLDLCLIVLLQLKLIGCAKTEWLGSAVEKSELTKKCFEFFFIRSWNEIAAHLYLVHTREQPHNQFWCADFLWCAGDRNRTEVKKL